MSKLSFFIGKGGVGKTTLAAAYAVRACGGRGPVLLISTDPAHSLADIFETRLGDAPRALPISGGKRLWVWQIDAAKQFSKFLGRHREAILELVEAGTIFSRREIEPLLDATLPGMAELSALLAIQELVGSRKYAEIVVDTAPMGHTLRLFSMPEHFARFLNFLDLALARDRILAQRFGGAVAARSTFVDEWRAIVEQVQTAISAENAQVTLVTTPETFALNESLRAAQALEQSPKITFTAIVLNRAVLSPGTCARCSRHARATREARAFLARNFRGIPVRQAEDSGGPVLGAASLRAFGDHVFGGKKLKKPNAAPVVPKLRLRPASWPDLPVSLSLTIGKGGVGKTTISAALAVHQRAAHRKTGVTVCSTDPAPSLSDVFRQRVGDRAAPVLGDAGLLAAEIDAVGEFHRWTEKMRARLDEAFRSEAGGVHVDLSFERQIVGALLDVVPPGVDEIFAVLRILDMLPGRGLLLIDMAPTGHALELLRMPGRLAQWSRLLLKSLAPHRTLPLAQEAAVEIAGVEQRVRQLVSMLRDASRSRVWPVMLAEPLPDRETARLIRQLQEIGTQAAPLFVNRVIFAEDARKCARCRRAQGWQLATLASLRRRMRGRELYVVRDFGQEIAGGPALKKLVRELWRVQ